MQNIRKKKLREENTNWQPKQENEKDKLEMKYSVIKIFYTAHVCDKVGCNQASNLFLKRYFPSMFFRQQGHVLVGKEVLAVNSMRGMLRDWVMLVKDLNLLKDVENKWDLWEYNPMISTGLLTKMLVVINALLYVLHKFLNTKNLTANVIHHGTMANL